MGIIKSYKKYSKGENTVNFKTYCKLTAGYHKFIFKNVLEGKEITLPCKLGTLSVTGKKEEIKYDENGKIVGLAPDWVKTKKLWDSNPEAKKKKQLLYHTNEHSYGIRYKFLWSKLKSTVQNKTLYALRIARVNKRAVHHKIKEGFNYKTTGGWKQITQQ